MPEKVKIGNNVLAGNDSTLLGAEKGNNVIIGAGSVVKGRIPDNCVAVGVPCKPIMTLNNFMRKKAVELKKAFLLVNENMKLNA